MAVTHRRRKRVTKRRDRARVFGFGAGFFSTAAIVFLATLIVGEMKEHATTEERCTWIGGICAVTLTGLGWLARFAANRKDACNYLVQKAPPLPLGLVNDHDDVWLEGTIHCPRAMKAPHFGTRCAWFHFVEEETRGHGKNERTVTVQDIKRHQRTWLEDDGRYIELPLELARMEHLPTETDSEWRRKFRLEYLLAEGPGSACGVAAKGAGDFGRENDEFWGHDVPDGQPWSLIPQSLVPAFGRRDEDAPPVPRDAAEGLPLLITPMDRENWIDDAESDEILLGVGGGFGLFAGLSAAVWWLGTTFGGLAVASVGWGIGSGALGFLLLLPILAVSKYNRFVGYRLRVHNARSHVDVDLKARHDLIPNLVEVAKGLAAHERETFEQVAEMRRQALAPDAALDRESALGRATGQVIGLVERYPELRSNDAFQRVAREITAIEEKIAFGRGFYNDVVAEYNSLIEVFPNAYFSRPLGFEPFSYWAD